MKYMERSAEMNISKHKMLEIPEEFYELVKEKLNDEFSMHYDESINKLSLSKKIPTHQNFMPGFSQDINKTTDNSDYIMKENEKWDL